MYWFKNSYLVVELFELYEILFDLSVHSRAADGNQISGQLLFLFLINLLNIAIQWVVFLFWLNELHKHFGIWPAYPVIPILFVVVLRCTCIIDVCVCMCVRLMSISFRLVHGIAHKNTWKSIKMTVKKHPLPSTMWLPKRNRQWHAIQCSSVTTDTDGVYVYKMRRDVHATTITEKQKINRFPSVVSYFLMKIPAKGSLVIL